MNHDDIFLTRDFSENSVIIEGFKSYDNQSADLVIPNTICDKDVVAIDHNAFSHNHNIQKVYISESVKEIGRGAFSFCNSLSSVEFSPESKITVIPERCFKCCPKLTRVSFPKSIGYINKEAFVECISLSDITLPSNLFATGELAFGYCTSIKNVVLPNTTIHLESNTFKGCDNIKINRNKEIKVDKATTSATKIKGKGFIKE